MFFLKLDRNSVLSASSSSWLWTQLWLLSCIRTAFVKYSAWVMGSKTRVCGWYKNGLVLEHNKRLIDHETRQETPSLSNTLRVASGAMLEKAWPRETGSRAPAIYLPAVTFPCWHGNNTIPSVEETSSPYLFGISKEAELCLCEINSNMVRPTVHNDRRLNRRKQCKQVLWESSNRLRHPFYRCGFIMATAVTPWRGPTIRPSDIVSLLFP